MKKGHEEGTLKRNMKIMSVRTTSFPKFQNSISIQVLGSWVKGRGVQIEIKFDEGSIPWQKLRLARSGDDLLKNMQKLGMVTHDRSHSKMENLNNFAQS